jgi:transposase
VEQITKRAPILRSRAERDELVEKWRASGKSVPRFAAEYGLADSSLYQWIAAKKKRGEKGNTGKGTRRKPKAAATFAEVNVVGPAATRSAAMTVALRGGHSVTFEGPAVDPAWLESVLKVVSAC